MNDNRMNIIIAINEKYVEPAKTMLFSLLENNKNSYINVYLLYSKLSSDSINGLRDFLRQTKRADLFDIQLNDDLFTEAPKMKWWSAEMYYRLLSFELISENKALWLDSDIIVNGDITEFYNSDLTDYYCAACKGCNQELGKKIGLPADHIYFNSGVILFNLDEIRRNFTKEDVFKIISDKADCLHAPDQDVLNIMFAGKILYVDEKIYNHETFGNYVISKNEMDVIKKKAKIIHFNGQVKPWDFKGVNWADSLWWRYELKRHKYPAYLRYRLFNMPVKCYYSGRELYYIAAAQIGKLIRRKS